MKLEETFRELVERLGDAKAAVKHVMRVYEYGSRHRFVRDWCIVDSSYSPNTMGKPTMVFYLPTGGSFLSDVPFKETVKAFRERPALDRKMLEQISENGRVRTFEECVRVVTPEQYFQSKSDLAGGTVAVIEEAIRQREDVVRHRFIGDFCVADLRGARDNPTLVYFVPTSGWCEYEEGFEEVVRRLEVDPKFGWQLFSIIVGPAGLLAALKTGAEIYSADSSISKTLRRVYGCDPASALRLQLAVTGCSRYEFVRDFCVVDLTALAPSDEKEVAAQIYYVPELDSIAAQLSYELVLEKIKSSSDEDVRLMERILLSEDRAAQTPEDVRVKKHYHGVTLIEKLRKEFGAEMRLIAQAAKLTRYERVRHWYVADVRSLEVHAPTLILAAPGGEWVLLEMEFEDAVAAIRGVDDETDRRWMKSIVEMSRDDRRYRTIGRLKLKD
jgi:hypothetical protein